jgi:DNA ligase-1
MGRDLADGESIEVQGSGSARYTLKNAGGVYSCTCPAWRNQSVAIERRSCKHLRALRGEEAEAARAGTPARGAAGTATGAPRPAARAVAKEGAPALLLAHTWENDVDLTGWWMSEKLDGVRAYWDGQRFVSRLGNAFFAPDWFTERLPAVPLDGELWGGRRQFQKTVSIVRRQDKSQHWADLRYVVFDAPALAEPFEARIAFVAEHIKTHAPPYVEAHTHERCRSLEHLRQELARVEALGGEGLMLRRPGSHYEAGRSSSLLKVKSFRDAEARIVEHQAGAGRHKGRLGALVVEMPDGTRFNIGTGFSDAERESPAPVGTIVTYRYQELSEAGVPRFPSYVGVRDDVAWPGTTKQSTKPTKATQKQTSKETSKETLKETPKDTLIEALKDSLKGSTNDLTKDSPPNASQKAVVAATISRRFEFVSGTSAKFWEIVVEGAQHRVRFGRLDSSGLEKVKTFSSPAAAEREALQLIREKLAKGYKEKKPEEA